MQACFKTHSIGNENNISHLQLTYLVQMHYFTDTTHLLCFIAEFSVQGKQIVFSIIANDRHIHIEWQVCTHRMLEFNSEYLFTLSTQILNVGGSFVWGKSLVTYASNTGWGRRATGNLQDGELIGGVKPEWVQLKPTRPAIAKYGQPS